ncbi:MAG TPA: hypothetical protein PLD84_10945, partial [Chitinophagales bacterium]|nr:hypothetical protein [Chitinophagales bacterium]
KGMHELEEKIQKLVTEYSGRQFTNWSVNHDYHFGGYAKVNEELLSFIRGFYSAQNILTDPVYTGKLMFGIFDLIRKDFFFRGATIVAIHIGGLQGWNGINGR